MADITLHTPLIRAWHEINTVLPCPIHLSDAELQAHACDGEGWNEAADFWASLEGFVWRDGWTAHETYAQARGLPPAA